MNRGNSVCGPYLMPQDGILVLKSNSDARFFREPMPVRSTGRRAWHVARRARHENHPLCNPPRSSRGPIMLLMGLWTMNAAARLRLFGIRHAFDEPGVVLILVLLGLGLTICPLVILGLDRAGRLSPELRNDLWQRYYSWLAMIPAIAVPIVLGAFWTILAVCVLSLFCFREFARATGFFREKLMKTFPTKVPSDSLGWIGSLKRTSDKSLFPMALGSCGHRITHQLRPINMNGRSILAVTSNERSCRAGHHRAQSGQRRPLVPSLHGADTHRHRRDRGRLDLAGSAQGLHPAGGDGEPQLPFLRHLSGAHRLHGQR